MGVKKIVIIGPESTGKSTLCEQLARHYNTIWCPEYAREYLLTNGTKYSYDDLLAIAKGQLALEDKYTEISNGQLTTANSKNSGHSLLFIDTNMYVMKVWCEYVFGKCHKWILEQIVKREYDFYLLCNTDLPWIKDELREYPDLKTREKLFKIYKDIMVNQPVPWALIEGDAINRLEMAASAVDKLLMKQ